jgi:hypothetical protein
LRQGGKLQNCCRRFGGIARRLGFALHGLAKPSNRGLIGVHGFREGN